MIIGQAPLIKDAMCLQGSFLRPAGSKRAEFERNPHE